MPLHLPFGDGPSSARTPVVLAPLGRSARATSFAAGETSTSRGGT